MTNIIEHTYTALANTGELRLTEKDYTDLWIWHGFVDKKNVTIFNVNSL